MYERKEEFKRLIDIDNNGKANRSELLSYVDPRHPRHALTEAAGLFDLADENSDQRLVLDEVNFMAMETFCSKFHQISYFASIGTEPCRCFHAIKIDIYVREFPRRILKVDDAIFRRTFCCIMCVVLIYLLK